MSVIPTPTSPIVYSVSELNNMVSVTLSENFLTLNITGEVSNFACPRSGHWYFSLKDDKAQVRCVFFHAKQRAPHLKIADGIQIIAQARLRLYEIRGEFQLNIESMEPIGDGLLQKRFEELKNRLAQEGLFDVSIKKRLPKLIKKVGLITSATGAAIRDVLSVLERRFRGMEIILYPTLVQGEEAANCIVKQIQIANQRQETQVLILTRGGGSLEDLWSFNEEKVARAIASSELPIISAVGHEIDFTIGDFVADVRAPTPSAAAELVSQDQNALMTGFLKYQHHLTQLINQHLLHYKQRLLSFKRCLRHPEQRLQNISQQLDDYERRLQYAIKRQQDMKSQKLVHLAHTLEALSPLATLLRGYSITQREKDDSILQSANQIAVGENVMVRLTKGKIVCEVKKRFITKE